MSFINIHAVSKKSFMAYLILTPYLILAFYFFIYMRHQPWLTLGVVLITIFIYKVLNILSVKWTLRDDSILVESGFLPWKKTNFSIPLNQIYEIYLTKSLWGMIFKYGGLRIRRTDGISSSFYENRMSKASKFVSTYYDLKLVLEVFKNEQNYDNKSEVSISVADEIFKLIELKEKGYLSDEDFEIQKNKMLNN